MTVKNADQEIINDLVIPNHEVNFGELNDRHITISQVFERYGKKIRNIVRNTDLEYKSNSCNQAINIVSPGQLKIVDISCVHATNAVNLPNHFQNVERFDFIGHNNVKLISAQFSASLHYLSLSHIELEPNFNWKGLRNLTELKLG